VKSVEKLKMAAEKTDKNLPFYHVYSHSLECVTDWRLNYW